MSGDNLSGLIRSGSSHSVSVSKHTGNAQNPKNIFHSDDEEAASEKPALKKQHVVESQANIQRVDSGESATNLQRFETDEVLENVQNVGVGIAAPNLQKFTNSAGASLNQQVIHQVSTDANKQSVHEAGPAGVNRQPTGKENLKDHFEVLPSNTIESARVNVDNSASQDSMGTEQPSSTGKGKQDDKPAHVKASLTAQQVTQTKRDAFLGRLAGIKRDVGSISHKLDVMENGS